MGVMGLADLGISLLGDVQPANGAKSSFVFANGRRRKKNGRNLGGCSSPVATPCMFMFSLNKKCRKLPKSKGSRFGKDE